MKLSPCPLCANPFLNFQEINVRGYVISCKCGLEFRTYEDSESEFIRLWNKRVK
jgi:hypothetical protein